jgi:hypothetical protein
MTFNFLGTMTEDDKSSLTSWMQSRYSLLSKIKEFYIYRSEQLRRSSGLLNAVMKAQGYTQTFKKELYQEPVGGVRLLTDSDDRKPAEIVSKIKNYTRDMLQVEDEAIFQMNNLCVLIEKMEDSAYLYSISEKDITSLLSELDKLFSDPNYSTVLLSKNDTYKGEPKYRTSSLAPRTAYEKDTIPSLIGG